MTLPQPGGPVPDLYELLGVARQASPADIAHAYRRKARVVHPDFRPQDIGAAAQFRALAEAYETLSDPVRRAAYDQGLRLRTAADPGTVPGSGAPPSPGGPAAPAPPLWPASSAMPGGPVPAARVPGPPLWAGPVRIDPPAAGPARDVPHEGYAPAGERDLLAFLTVLANRYLDDGWYESW